MTHQGPVRAGFAGVFVGTLALLAAACGNSPQAGVASLGTTTTTTTTQSSASAATTGGGAQPVSAGGATGSPSGGHQASSIAMSVGSYTAALEFAKCMRSHGVPDFPDPNSNGTIQFGSGSGANPGSPQFQKAQEACRKFLPNKGAPPSPAQQAKMMAQALQYSKCMRAHGITSFPDPQAVNGGIRIALRSGKGSNLNPNNPQFQAAQKACQGLMPGPKGGAPGVAK